MLDPMSGITWLKEADWIGTELAFDEAPSKWKIINKLSETEDICSESVVKAWGDGSEVRAVFACANVEDPAQEAVVKIRMQVPWIDTWSKSLQERAQQALSGPRERTTLEVAALKRLTEAGCSSAPRFYSWKTEIQGTAEWVPGGYRDYILMGKLPGSDAGDSLEDVCWDPEVVNQIQAAFKVAWEECIACGLYHGDGASRNLLWDPAQKKCYLIDWETWFETSQMDERAALWSEYHLSEWNLVEYKSGYEES